MIVWNKEFVGRWVGKALGCHFDGSHQAVGFTDNFKLLGGIVFHNFRPQDEKGPASIEGSIYSTTPRWCSKTNLKAIFHYVFVVAKCYKFYAVIEATNQQAIVFLCRLGFSEEGRLKDHFWSGDGIVFGMSKDNCQWLEEPDGQEQRTSRT